MKVRDDLSESASETVNSIYWNDFRIQHCDWSPDQFSLFAWCDSQQAGRAHVTIDDSLATLVDIFVYERTVFRCPSLKLGKKVISYRGKGLGSQLLSMVIEHARVRGAKEITGQMVGDVEKLAGWYQRHGFVVSERAINICF